MTDKQEIKHALNNWQDENYICGYGLYVLNSCLGHDIYTLDYSQVEEFKRKHNLQSVKFDNRNASVLYNHTYIAKRIVQMGKQNKEYRKLLYKNKKELQSYSETLSQ